MEFRIVALAALAASLAAAQERSGETIFKEECARCHGVAGQGTKHASKPLVGEKSPAQLAAVIGKTMPDDDPETITDDEAKKVAAYIHDAFYSPDARARLNPPRVELARLTVRQYRNAIADLTAINPGKPAKIEERHGLHGEYFDARSFDGRGGGRKPLLERIDPTVRFDFGVDSPLGPEPKSPPPPPFVGPPTLRELTFVGPPPQTAAQKAEPKKFNPKQFCVSWEGSVFAPETGVYEFNVRSEHGVQLWVNDQNIKRPLIDAQVRSGGDAQQLSGTILLLAGRSYSLRLEFCKGKELDKKALDNPKRESRPASVELWWKPPFSEAEIVPARYLSPMKSAEVLVVNTPFPPDDRSYGWERGTTVSKEWNTATTDAALETADYVVVRLPALAGVALDAPDAKVKLRAFCSRFAERAFRRPLTDAEKHTFVERQFEATPDLEDAVKRVVLLVLKSPRFLYPGIMTGPHAVATRLSFALWDSLPDSTLLDAAAANKLATHADLAAQAERMLGAPLARAKLHEFLLTWLRVERFPELAKDTKRFPGFDAAVAADLRKSLGLFVDDVVWSEASDFRQLLLSDEIFMNGRLAKFYGVSLPAGADFTRVKWESDKRSGVLTHPYMLAGLAYPGESSPIHRGVFVVRGLLGMTLQPPPEAVVPLAPQMHPNLTTRDRVTLQTKPAACTQCHSLINPLGFALENFDAVGRFREQDNGRPIDVSGHFENRAGEVTAFSGARPLAALLAHDEQVQAAFTQQLFQHMVKQPVRAYGLTLPKDLQTSFSKSNFNVRKLMVEIATIVAQPPEGSDK